MNQLIVGDSWQFDEESRHSAKNQILYDGEEAEFGIEKIDERSGRRAGSNGGDVVDVLVDPVELLDPDDPDEPLEPIGPIEHLVSELSMLSTLIA